MTLGSDVRFRFVNEEKMNHAKKGTEMTRSAFTRGWLIIHDVRFVCACAFRRAARARGERTRAS